MPLRPPKAVDDLEQFERDLVAFGADHGLRFSITPEARLRAAKKLDAAVASALPPNASWEQIVEVKWQQFVIVADELFEIIVPARAVN